MIMDATIMGVLIMDITDIIIILILIIILLEINIHTEMKNTTTRIDVISIREGTTVIQQHQIQEEEALF